MAQYCSNCKRYGNNLKQCSGCKTALYCSTGCQREHWPRHKVMCTRKRPSQEKPDPSRKPVKQPCSFCKAYAAVLKRCTGCSITAYCSKSCQQAHWPKHKANCKRSTQNASNDFANQDQPCGYCNAYGEDLKKCTGCRVTAYCSKSCQQAHWPKHKDSCTRLSASVDATKDSPNLVPQCSNCQVYDEALKKCAKCKVTAYCSEACQLDHMSEHLRTCLFLRKTEGSKNKPPADPVSGTNPARDTYSRGFERGSAMSEEPYPTVDIFLPPVAPPDPEELSALLRRLLWYPPGRRFFELPPGEQFTFITDSEDVPHESHGRSMLEARKTVLIAKIVAMSRDWRQRGILVVGDERPFIFAHMADTVKFYIPGMNPFPFFKWSDVVPGNYICIRAPVFHTSLTGTEGFRIKHASDVRILSPFGQLIFGI